MRVTLAAGTALGAGTAVSLPAALTGLTRTGAQVTVIVAPSAQVRDGDAGLTVIRSSRAVAMGREVLGSGSADVYIGFCDRLPLLRRGGRVQVLVVQNPHLYASSDVATTVASRAKFAALAWWARRSVQRADRVICSTSASRSEVAAATGVDPAGIEVIPIPATGISATKPEQRDRIERVLLVGDLYSYKHTEMAVRAVGLFAAAHQDRPVSLVHVGSDRHPDAVRSFDEAVAEAQRAGATTTQLGAISHEQVIAEMARADVIVMASDTETQGLPLVEAMAVGLPVVARAIGPFVEIGGDAFVSVPVEGGPAEFAAALASIDTRASRAALSEHGRALHPPGDSWDLLPAT